MHKEFLLHSGLSGVLICVVQWYMEFLVWVRDIIVRVLAVLSCSI